MGRSPVKTRTPTLTAETWWTTTGLLALLAAVLSESPAKKGVILHRSLEKGPLSKESCFNLQALRLRYVADRFLEMMYNVKLKWHHFLFILRWILTISHSIMSFFDHNHYLQKVACTTSYNCKTEYFL